MIQKFLFIFLSLSIVLDSVYTQQHQLRRKNRTSITKNTSQNGLDDYYDYYDYDISSGNKQKNSETFVYCFGSIIIFFVNNFNFIIHE